MKRTIYYTIDKNRISEDKTDVRQALKNGAEVSKMVRIEYRTGPTTVITATITTITHPKEI